MIGKLFSYIKKPACCIENEDISGIVFFKLLLLFYVVLLPCSGLLILLQVFELLPHNKAADFDDSLHSLAYILFLAPFLEELFFRLPLKISRLTFSISLSVLILVLIRLFVFQKANYIFYLLMIPVAAVVYFFLTYNWKYYTNIKAFWIKYFRIIFYLSSFLFGFLHLFNYSEIYGWMVLISPLITLPFIAMGLFLAYIRMAYGFFYSFLFHVVINLIPSLPMIMRL